jgi:transcriptional regulator with XRE-family HTH domain
MLASEIIAKLKSERRRQRLSRDAISAITGYEESGIKKWENGIVSPSFHAVVDVADVLGFNLVLVRKKTLAAGDGD